MPTALRVGILVFVIPAVFYFTFWMGAALLSSFLPSGIDAVLAMILAVFCAVKSGKFVWIKSADFNQDGHAPAWQLFLIRTLLGAFIVGGIGFVGGFFGPMIFAPDANQGPLLGLFITGPLGFALGAVGGALYHFLWAKSPST